METFKIGDEARITANDGAHNFDVGDVGKVEAVCKDIGYWVGVDGKKFKQIVRADQMIHIIKPVLATPAPPAAPAVTSRAVVLTVEGVEYTAVFTFAEKYTLVLVAWAEGNRVNGLNGHSSCNPHDTYNAETGMRVAMRRACGIGNPHAHSLPAVYSAFRKWQHDQAAPQSKQVKPLAVGAEVRAVKDSSGTGRTFRKGARGKVEIIGVAYKEYFVRWISGDFERDDVGFPNFARNCWWARADEIEAV